MMLSTGGDNHVDNSVAALLLPCILTPVTQLTGVMRDISLDKLCTPL
jgi:hypothetical protein